MKKPVWFTALAFAALVALVPCGVVADPVISPGTPTTTVPIYLTDGSYWFPTAIPDPLDPDEFLLPVDITGAVNLQTWQFDLLFDNTVVQVVDPSDGSSGIYGAQFTPGDPNTLSFILSGFPFNFLGLVDDVAGSYPASLTGPSGDGTLAFILFQFLPDQENNNPGFSIVNPSVTQAAPEPTTLALLLSGLLLLGAHHLIRRERHG